MYDELIKWLRVFCEDCKQWDGCKCCLKGECSQQKILQAADAIEELSKPKWIMFESRPMDKEERQYYSEHYGYELADDEAVIYCSQLPDHDQEVLVCNKYGHIWIDRFDNDPDYGVGFETNGDMDGLVAWMPLPQPPESEGT